MVVEAVFFRPRLLGLSIYVGWCVKRTEAADFQSGHQAETLINQRLEPQMTYQVLPNHHIDTSY